MSLQDEINKAEIELIHREKENPNLRGIPKIQNETAINKLYDLLNKLNIQVVESV